MPYILRVDASSRHTESHSRQIADQIERALLASNSELSVRRCDLAAEPIPHIADETITGFYSPPEALTEDLRKATALSDALISDLKGAQALIISSPMYNFGVPSALKAWVDHIVRINATFAFDGTSFEGLVRVPRAYLALAYGAGGYADGGPFSAMDFLESYLASLMGFIGIEETQVFRLEGTTGDAVSLNSAARALSAQIESELSRGAA